MRVAKANLDAHLDRAVSLQELAAQVDLSPFYLRRSFSAAVGLTPHRFQIEHRIERAKRLLATGSSIADAARAAGFTDQSHPSRRFRRHVGVPPGRFVVGPDVAVG